MPSALSHLPSNFEARQKTHFFFGQHHTRQTSKIKKKLGDIPVEPEEEEEEANTIFAGESVFPPRNRLAVKRPERAVAWRPRAIRIKLLPDKLPPINSPIIFLMYSHIP